MEISLKEKKFIIATGSKARELTHLKDSSKEVMTAKDIFNMKSLPDSMTIIGAGANWY